MSAIDKRLQDLAILALTKIGEFAGSSKAADAARVLLVIERIVSAVQAGLSRQMTPDELASAIEVESTTLAQALAANKQIIQSELDKKFPT